ncbi:MAG: hypothetical protein SFV18_20665 [Bryobacteraceae bacterium]|nr:hypothetical protein [Bryobacteraceae bacterium]
MDLPAALDPFPVPDPWIGVIAFLCVAAPLLSRLVGSEIGAPRRSSSAPWVVGLGLIAIWCGVRYVCHTRAIATLEARVYEGRAPKRVAAIPDAWNPLAFRGLVETPALIQEVPVELWSQFDPEAGETYYPPEERAAIEKFEQTAEFARARGMRWPVTQVIPVENAWEVTRRDLRSGREVRAVVPR